MLLNQLKSKIRFTKKTEPRKLLQSTYLKVNVFKRKRVKGCFFRPSLFTDCQWGRFFYLSPLVSPPTLFSWIVGTLHIVCRFQGDWVDRLLPSMFLAIIRYIVGMLALNPRTIEASHELKFHSTNNIWVKRILCRHYSNDRSSVKTTKPPLVRNFI